MTNSYAIGLDLGGTRIKSVAVDSSGTVLHQSYRPTDDGNDQVWKQSVASSIEEIITALGQDPIVGISAPGLPNAENSCISFMPGRLQGLEQFNWSDYLQRKTVVINDAVAALMAEARFGACRTAKNAVMLTLGTGVGGAILIDGKPYQGEFNKAGHIGHMVIDDEGEQDVTGMPGSLEECIGNCTILKRSSGRFSSTQALLEAYRKNDSQAADIWLKSVRQLALGIASISNILSPECVVLGGGITEAGEDLFQPLERFLEIYEWRPGGARTQIRKADHGDLSGAIGAAAFAMQLQ
ncbi:MAG: ROK family protein [Chitinophagaceae bacterium]|jgi:glucokinase